MTVTIGKLRAVLVAFLLCMSGIAMAQRMADSIQYIPSDDIDLAQSDSLSIPELVSELDSVGGVENAVMPPDTLSTDSIVEKEEPLDAPVIYESSDSMIWVMGGDATLFGSSKVQYQNITLDAAVIRMQIDSSLVYADGVQDTLGKVIPF